MIFDKNKEYKYGKDEEFTFFVSVDTGKYIYGHRYRRGDDEAYPLCLLKENAILLLSPIKK